MLSKVVFQPGYIYGFEKIRGETAASRKILAAELNAKKLLVAHGYSRWGAYDTPLKKYSLAADFEKYLTIQANRARKEGRKIRVLDVGIGSGRQWVEFMKLHGNVVELHATGLDEVPINGLPVNFKRVTADLLHRKFQEGYFDVVVAYFGIHGQGHAAIENILHLLTPGGVGFVTSTKAFGEGIPTVNKAFKQIATLHARTPVRTNSTWSIKFRKRLVF